MKTEKDTVKIKIERLQEIARYYDIPLAVLISDVPFPKDTTRNEEWSKAYHKIQIIKDVLEDE